MSVTGNTVASSINWRRAVRLFWRWLTSGRLTSGRLTSGRLASRTALRRADLALAGGNLAEAAAACDDAVRLDLDSVDAYSLRSNVRAALGDTAGAEQDLAAVDRLRPRYAARAVQKGMEESAVTRLNDRGAVHFLEGRIKEAIADFDEVLRLEPDCVEAVANRGSAYHYLGRADDAIVDLSKAIQLAPTNATFLVNRGRVWVDGKAFDKAVADFCEAHRLQPRDLAIVELRGLAYFNHGEFSKAIADLDLVLEHFSTPLAFHGRGMARSRLGDYAGAISDLTNAFRG